MSNSRDNYINNIKNGTISISDIPVDEIDDGIYLAAVKANWRALDKIPNKKRNETLCIEAVRNNWKALKYVPFKIKRSTSVCKVAVEKSWEALEFVPNELCNDDLIKIGVEQDIDALKYCPEENYTDELCEWLIQKNWKTFLYFPDDRHTESICRKAISQNWKAFNYIRDDLKQQLYQEEVQKSWEKIRDVPIKHRTLALCTEALNQSLQAVEDFPEPILKIHINETLKIIRENPSYLDGISLHINTAADTAHEQILSQGATYYKILLEHIANKKSDELNKQVLYDEIIKGAINKNNLSSLLTRSYDNQSTLTVDLADLLKYAKKYAAENWSEISFYILNVAIKFPVHSDTRRIYSLFQKETIYDWISLAIDKNQLHVLIDLINKNEINFNELSQYISSRYPELIEKLETKKYFIQNKGISISQNIIRRKLLIFLKMQKSDSSIIRDFDLIEGAALGHCSALAFQFLYGKYLEDHPDENDKKARDDNAWFFTTLYEVASWDETKKSLSDDKILLFERLISLMQVFQSGLYDLLGMAGGQSLLSIFSDTKNRQLIREDSVTGFFDGQSLALVLPELIKKESLVYIDASIKSEGKNSSLTGHTTGIYYSGNYYYFYNSRFDDGARITTNMNELTEWIFESYQFKINSIEQLSFINYGFSQHYKPINHKAILDKSYISSNVNNIKSLFQAIKINCLDSVKYFLDKVDINIEYENSSPLSFALAFSGPNGDPNEAIISYLINKGAISNASVQLRAEYLAKSADYDYNPTYIKLILNELIKINAIEVTLNQKNHFTFVNTILHKVLDKNFPSDVIIMILQGNADLMAINKWEEIPLKLIIDKHEQYADVLDYCIKNRPNEIANVINEAIENNQVNEIRPLFNALKSFSFEDVCFKEIYSKLSSNSKYTVVRECNIPPPPTPANLPSLKSREKFFQSAPPANTKIDPLTSQLPTDDKQNSVINNKKSK